MGRDRLLPGPNKLVAASYRATDAVVVTVGAAGAAGGATAVPVDALSGPIPSGTTLHFGTNKYATLSADAAAGATSLATLAIPTALVDNDTATYAGTERATVPIGTVVTRADSDDPWGPPNNAHPHIGLVAFTVLDVTENDDVEIARPGIGTVVHRNYLPAGSEWAGLSATIQNLLIANFNITVAHE
jgi:hypothetical protein